MKVKWIDPPSGWRYGFPKIDDWDSSKETRENWWIRKGYPVDRLSDIELGCWMHEEDVLDIDEKV